MCQYFALFILIIYVGLNIILKEGRFMSSVQNINNTNAQGKIITNTDKKNKPDQKTFLLSSNPIVDAVGMGAGCALTGVAADTFTQMQRFKNPEKLGKEIASVKEELSELKNTNIQVSKKDIKIKHLEEALDCLKNKKINVKSLSNWAKGMGIAGLIFTLIPNLIYWTGKKGYEQLKESE